MKLWTFARGKIRIFTLERLRRRYLRPAGELPAISASEVATRLDLQSRPPKTSSNPWRNWTFCTRRNPGEKRPYYRYILKQSRIVIDIDLMQVKQNLRTTAFPCVSERRRMPERACHARNADTITNVTIWPVRGGAN